MLSSKTYSEGFFEWQRTNIQLSRGNTFELGAEKRTLITLEHVDGYKFGDNYFFYDYTTTTNTSYAEWRTRLSLNKMSGQDVSFGLVTDVLFAALFEFPEDIPNRQAYGIGVNLDVPGFQSFGANLFSRDDSRFSGRAAMLMFNWRAELDFGAPVSFEGFCDIQASEGERNSWVHCQPRLLLDLGHFRGKKGKLFAGFEYQYWSDKFGAGITDEKALQAQLKYIF